MTKRKLKKTECPDCGAPPGRVHSRNCDVERCSVCDGQRLGCRCAGHNTHAARWTGHWPGDERASELGWFTSLTPLGWRPCGGDVQDSQPDGERWLFLRKHGFDGYHASEADCEAKVVSFAVQSGKLLVGDPSRLQADSGCQSELNAYESGRPLEVPAVNGTWHTTASHATLKELMTVSRTEWGDLVVLAMLEARHQDHLGRGMEWIGLDQTLISVSGRVAVLDAGAALAEEARAALPSQETRMIDLARLAAPNTGQWAGADGCGFVCAAGIAREPSALGQSRRIEAHCRLEGAYDGKPDEAGQGAGGVIGLRLRFE